MKRIFFFNFLFFCFIHCAHASLISLIKNQNGNWLLNGGVGLSFSDVRKENFILPGTNWPKDRYSIHDVHPAALFSLSAGYRWKREKFWIPFYSLSLNFTNAFSAQVRGSIQQYALPQFENYDFEYKIERQTFQLIAKTDLYQCNRTLPFVEFGVGATLNTFRDYQETALPNVTPRVTPGFKNHTHINVTSMIGVGLDYLLQKNYWLSLEYQYAYFGDVHSAGGGRNLSLTGMDYSNAHLETRLSASQLILSLNTLLM